MIDLEPLRATLNKHKCSPSADIRALVEILSTLSDEIESLKGSFPAPSPIECSCGKWYADQKGVDLCVANGHGSGRDEFGKKMTLKHTIEQEIAVVCAECNASIRSYIRYIGNNNSCIEINVLPHVCGVDDPEL